MKKKELQELVLRLESDIRDLVLRPYSWESMMIKTKVTMANDLEQAAWIGKTTLDLEKAGFQGLIKEIDKATNALSGS